MVMETGNIIVDMTFHFALDIVSFTDILEENRKFTIARQLLRSGTSIGANIKEAQNGESRADFIHKSKIAAKEETLLDKLINIKKVINKIISSSYKKR